jgi:hypothetical protein
MAKNSRSGFGMNIPDNIFESLETIFWVKKLKFFDTDSDPIRDRKNSDPGSAINIPDPHHWVVQGLLVITGTYGKPVYNHNFVVVAILSVILEAVVITCRNFKGRV